MEVALRAANTCKITEFVVLNGGHTRQQVGLQHAVIDFEVAPMADDDAQKST